MGCGPLRGGVHFIGYLEPGHYYGVDKNAKVLETARELELKRYGVEDKELPTLVLMDDFDFARSVRRSTTCGRSRSSPTSR